MRRNVLVTIAIFVWAAGVVFGVRHVERWQDWNRVHAARCSAWRIVSGCGSDY